MAGNYRKCYRNGTSLVVAFPVNVVKAMKLDKHSEVEFTVTGPTTVKIDLVRSVNAKYNNEVKE